eukprot:7414532-Karenia_brevis.AAC.1
MYAATLRSFVDDNRSISSGTEAWVAQAQRQTCKTPLAGLKDSKMTTIIGSKKKLVELHGQYLEIRPG